jgi:glycosyltransferase involved in cell wall biosynthesis
MGTCRGDVHRRRHDDVAIESSPNREIALSELAPSRPAYEPVGKGHRLLVVNHVPQAHRGGRVFMDEQTVAGVAQYAWNFDHVTICGPSAIDAPRDLVEVPATIFGTTISLHALPSAYGVTDYVRQRRSVRRTLAELASDHDVVVGAIGGLVGDWPTDLAFVCEQAGIPHAVWFDRIEWDVMRHDAIGGGARRRARRAVEVALMKRRDRTVTERADVMIAQGAETFDSLSAYSRRPMLVFDSHVQPDDLITEQQLDEKIASLADAPIRIVYAGRVDAMKGPLEWIRCLSGARAAGARFRASWFGAGELLDASRRLVGELDLTDCVEFMGEISHREVLARMRDAAVMLCCHQTKESPRCIVEAAASGCAIISYNSPYVRGVLGNTQVGPQRGQWRELGDLVAGTLADPTALERSMRSNADRGRFFTESAVYRHRAASMAAVANRRYRNNQAVQALDPRFAPHS